MTDQPGAPPVDFRVASTEEDILDAYSVRHQVFVLEQQVPPVLEVDARDYRDSTVHFVGHTGEPRSRAVAAGRLLQQASRTPEASLTFWVGRVAVVPSFRGKGVGLAMMETIIEAAKERASKHSGAQIFLDAQVSATGFYTRLGFEPTNKETFLDAGILHQEMVLDVVGEA